MKKLTLILSMFLGVTLGINAQHLFIEQFKGCEADQFSMESKITQARISQEDFLKPVFYDLKEDIRKKLDGELKLQILVDQDGNACLVSADNKTNVPSKKLKIDKTVRLTKWTNNTQNVCAIVVLFFEDGEVNMARLGLNSKIGWHEITDEPNPKYGKTKE